MAILEIDPKALRDERFSYLGELTGKGKFDARARVENLWFDCIEKTNDHRTADDVDALTGWFNPDGVRFADLMVKAKLAEQVPSKSKQNDEQANQMPGVYRIKGVANRMKWLEELRSKRKEFGSRGGKKRAENARRGKGGRFSADESQANTKQTPGEYPSKAMGSLGRHRHPGTGRRLPSIPKLARSGQEGSLI